MGSIAPN